VHLRESAGLIGLTKGNRSRHEAAVAFARMRPEQQRVEDEGMKGLCREEDEQQRMNSRPE
jgi:hypothetical protein